MTLTPTRLVLLGACLAALFAACDIPLETGNDPLKDKDAGSTQQPPGTQQDSGTQQQQPMDSGTQNPPPMDSGTQQPPMDAGTQSPPDAGTQNPPDAGNPGTPTMSFFVTSRGNGKGGDFRLNAADTDGLAGADAFCKQLATAVSATLGAKTWRAYLSTNQVDARDRIGAGPWRNQKGVIVASSVAQLHEEGGLTNAISAANSVDENGVALANGVHDILTGSTIAGRVMGTNTCANWTSTAAGTATVGHSNRMGGGSTSWNSVHTTASCSSTGVTSGGGRGSLYCFALEGG